MATKSSTKTLKFKLKPLEGYGKKIPVGIVVQSLNALQSAVYHLGDYILDPEFRSRGPISKTVLEKCTLVFSRVGMNSFEAELELKDQQAPIPEQLTIGEASLETLGKIINLISQSDDPEVEINKTVKKYYHRFRLIHDISNLWPSKEKEFESYFQIGDNNAIPITFEKRPIVDKMLKHVSTPPKEMKVSGILGTAKVIDNKMIKIKTTDGEIKCKKTPKLEELRKFLGKPVHVIGHANLDYVGNITEFTEITQIMPFDTLNLERLYWKNKEIQLLSPLTLKIDYQDDLWLMENEDLGIICAEKDYIKCLDDIQEEFFFLIDKYVKANDEKLTEGARKLKNKILKLIKEDER